VIAGICNFFSEADNIDPCTSDVYFDFSVGFSYTTSIISNIMDVLARYF